MVVTLRPSTSAASRRNGRGRPGRDPRHELAGRVLDLMARHPAWSLPLAYKDGVYGAERVPSGAYLGDRDMFLFLCAGQTGMVS